MARGSSYIPASTLLLISVIIKLIIICLGIV